MIFIVLTTVIFPFLESSLDVAGLHSNVNVLLRNEGRPALDFVEIVDSGLIGSGAYAVHYEEERRDDTTVQALYWTSQSATTEAPRTNAIWQTSRPAKSPQSFLAAGRSAYEDVLVVLSEDVQAPAIHRKLVLWVSSDDHVSERELPLLSQERVMNPGRIIAGGDSGAWLVYCDEEQVFAARIDADSMSGPIEVAGAYPRESGLRFGWSQDTFGLSATGDGAGGIVIAWPTMIENDIKLVTRRVTTEFELQELRVITDGGSLMVRPSLSMSYDGSARIAWIELPSVRSTTGKAFVGISRPVREDMDIYELTPPDRWIASAVAVCSAGEATLVSWREEDDSGAAFVISQMFRQDLEPITHAQLRGISPSSSRLNRFLKVDCFSDERCGIFWQQLDDPAKISAQLSWVMVDMREDDNPPANELDHSSRHHHRRWNLREHWSGEEDVLTMIRNVLRVGDNLVNKKFVDRVKRIVE